jgi:CSLREA domain-containing protein
MISNAHGQLLLSFSPQFRKNTAWPIALGITLLGVFLSAAAQAAVFTVNSPSDAVDVAPGDGLCVTALGNCTLRAAIQEANALAGADAIILPPDTYLLIIVSDLEITDSLTLTGGGASTTIIDGNKSVRPNSRVLAAGSGITVNISGVTIHNGGTDGSGGGGIFNAGTLTLSTSTVSGNNATNNGGSIDDDAGDGGGIYNSSTGTVTLTHSTVSGNNAGDDGGGMRNVAGGTVTLTHSTVSGNTAGDGGGGIRNAGTLTLINSTVSGNTAGGDGGGIYNFSGTAQAFNSTITANWAGAELNGTGLGGGVHNAAGATFTFQNTILADNSETLPVGDFFVATPGECDGTIISSGNNLMEHYDTSHCTVTGSPLLADPKLGPLQNNGGPTQTHALLVGSPAIDGGDPSGCRDNLGALLLEDQRGFPRTVDGNRDGTAQCDIGAVEFGSGAGVTVNFEGP